MTILTSIIPQFDACDCEKAYNVDKSGFSLYRAIATRSARRQEPSSHDGGGLPAERGDRMVGPVVPPNKYTLSGIAWQSARVISVESATLRLAAMGSKVMKSLLYVMATRLRQTTPARS